MSAGSIPARPLADPAVRRVAIIRLRVGLGDLLASVPALRALRIARPDVRVTVVSWPETAPVLSRQAAYVDELLPFPGFPGIPERRPRLSALPAFLRRARRSRFDLAVQMYGGLSAANAVAALLGARRVGGFFTPGACEADLGTHLPYPARLPEVERHLRLVEFLGVPGGSARMEFPLRPDDLERLQRLLREHRIAPGGYAVLHPGATAASRRWPAARFAAVADRLAAEGLRPVLTGVASERRLLGEVRATMRARAVDLGGATDLGAFAALLRSAALLVGNESGPAQLAAALGVPSVTIFMAGDSRRWRSPDPRLHRVVEAGVGCQPCGHLACPIDFRCATGVSAERVSAEALDVLGTAAPARVG